MGSNSHKTRSLQELLKYSDIYEFNEVPTNQDIDKMSDLVMAYIAKGDVVRDEIKKRALQLYLEAMQIKSLIQ